MQSPVTNTAATVGNASDTDGGGKAAFLLVVLTQAETGSPDRMVDVEIWPPTGDEPLHIAYEMPEAAIAGEIGSAFFEVEVVLPVDGRWVILVTGGHGVISLPLVVSG
jgi:hypothetical protein